MGNLVVTAKIGSNTMTKHTKVLGPLKCSVIFKRLDNYDGEYGFDDVIRDYEGVCKNTEALKKVYLKKTVYGNEYYVPWISMFPNHERVVGKKVKLKLELEILEESIKKHDLIVIPPKNGIRFEPSEFNASDLPQEVTVYCDQPLTSDTVVEVYQRSNKNKDLNVEVGYLHFLKNAKTYHFNIRIVKVLRDKSKEADLQTINSALTSVDLENYLNKNSLQQALIQTKIEDEVEMEIDTKKLEEEGYLKGDKIIEVPNKPEIIDVFVDLYRNNFENNNAFKGIVILIMPLQDSSFYGKGKPLPVKHRECFIYKDGINYLKTYSHEIGHILGLEESFTDPEITRKETHKKYDKAIANNEKYLNETILKNERLNSENLSKYKELLSCEKKDLEDPSYSSNEREIIKKNIKTYKEILEEYRNESIIIQNKKQRFKSSIERLKNSKNDIDIVYNSNNISFEIYSTDNIMDYSTKFSSYRFYYNQWSIMQNDITKYHGY